MKYKQGNQYIEMDTESENNIIDSLRPYYARIGPNLLFKRGYLSTDSGYLHIDSNILQGKLIPTILGEEYVSTIYRNSKR